MLNKFLYAIIYTISLLPLPILLTLSTITAYLNFYVFGYRKKLVLKNLSNSFPDKSKQEILAIAKQFYVVLFASAMESLKLFSVDIKDIQKRTKILNPEILQDPELRHKNVAGVCGHLFNWEWLVGVRHLAPQEKMYGVYHPLKSEFWNEKVKKSRAIAGSILLSSFETKEFIKGNPNDGNALYIFVCDQSPAIYKKPKAVVHFLNQPTAVLTGWEEIAIENAFNVIYLEPIFVKLGHYNYRIHHITPDNPDGFEPMELITKYHQLLEESILKQPFNYLWSHKKWKHEITLPHQ